jgi:sulfur relay (sulfurtransferase) complex TusBCD TusD component (DsrE family)
MKKVVLLVFALLMFTSLHAYTKKIIFASFSNMENAEKSFKTFQESSLFQKLEALAKKNNFEIHTRESGKYTIVVAEPFYSKEVLEQAYVIAKQMYKSAYINKYEAPQVASLKNETQEQKKLQPAKEVNVEKKPTQVKEKKPAITKEKKQEERQEENIEEVLEIQPIDNKVVDTTSESIEKTKEFAFGLLDIVVYLIMALIIGAIIYYVIKFKRIFDQY